MMSEADDTVHAAIPFDVCTYINRYQRSLDARRFEALRFVNPRRLFVHVPRVGIFETSVHAWRERLRHLADRGVELVSGLEHAVDRPFVLFEEDSWYVRRVTDLSVALMASEDQVPLDLELCVFNRSIDLAWFRGEGSRQV